MTQCAVVLLFVTMCNGATITTLDRAKTLHFLRIMGGSTAPMNSLLDSFATNTSAELVYSGSNNINTEFAKPNMVTLLKLYQNNLMEYFTGATITSFIEQGLLRRLDNLYTREGLHTTIPKSLSDTCRHPTIPGYYCVPFNTYSWAMYYRPSVFASLGITTPPSSWDELLSAFAKMRSAGITPMEYPLGSPWYSGAWFDYLNMRVNGVDFHRNVTQGKTSYTDERIHKLMDFWKNLVDEGNMKPIPGSWAAVRNGLVEKRVGVFLIGDFTRWGYAPLDHDIDFFRFPIVDPTLLVGEDAPCDSYIIPSGVQAGAPETPESIGLEAERLLGQMMSTEFMLNNSAMYSIPANSKAMSKADALSVKSAKLLSDSDVIFQFFDRDCPRDFALRAIKQLTMFVNGTPKGEVLAQLNADRMDVYFGLISPPSMSPEGGTFQTLVSISLSTLTSGADVYYTTDDSVPTIYSSLFNASRPIVLSEAGTYTVKAFAAKRGLDPSPMTQMVFVVTSSEEDNVLIIVLPVVGGVMLVILVVVLWKGSANYRQMRKLLSAVALAENTAESVAEMDFDGVQFLYDIENPSRLHLAFIKIVHNLELYKSFLPAALLERLQHDDSDTSDLRATAPGVDTHTAALVFTDIRKSTVIWEAVPEAMKRAMRVHNNIMREAVKEFGGYEVKTIGDAFMVAFDSPLDAVKMGVAAQLRLSEATWPADLSDLGMCAKQIKSDSNKVLWSGLSIRVGVNYGEVSVEESAMTGRADYFGHTVNVAARLESNGAVGAVTVSNAIWEDISARISGCIASAPNPITLAGVKDPIPVRSVYPTALAERAVQPLVISSAVAVRDCESTTSANSRPTTVRNVKSAISSDRGNIVQASIVTAELLTDDVSHAVGAQLSLGVTLALQALDRCQGMLIGVVGNNVCGGFNLTGRTASHSENAVRFAQLVKSSPIAHCVGIMAGTVWHGNVGSTQRFVTAFGGAVKGSQKLCTLAYDPGRILFAIERSEEDRPVPVPGPSGGTTPGRGGEISSALRRNLKDTDLKVKNAAVYEVAMSVDEYAYPDNEC